MKGVIFIRHSCIVLFASLILKSDGNFVKIWRKINRSNDMILENVIFKCACFYLHYSSTISQGFMRFLYCVASIPWKGLFGLNWSGSFRISPVFLTSWTNVFIFSFSIESLSTRRQTSVIPVSKQRTPRIVKKCTCKDEQIWKCSRYCWEILTIEL